MILSRVFVTLIGGIPFLVKATSPDYQCSTVPRVLFSAQTPLCLKQNADSTAETEEYDHPIWSHAPFCITTKNKSEYCTHTTADFRRGHGLSIIAYPEAADVISKAFEASRQAPVISSTSLEVRDIPGKGKGVIATRPIKKETVILLDTPHIIASAQFPAHVVQSAGISLFNKAVDRLPDADRTRVLSLDRSLGGDFVGDIFKTNAFACQISDGVGDGYMCLFPSVSRINHACRPNSHARFIPKTLLMEIKTLRDIKAGEEISISYGRIDLKHAERQKLYREGWGFKCTCDLCTADAYAIAGSDQRRARFAQVRMHLDHLTAETFDPQQVLAWEKEVLELSEKEGLGILNAEDYERMAYVHAGMGMPEQAKDWARKARDHLKEWTIVDGGPDNELRRVDDLLSELGG